MKKKLMVLGLAIIPIVGLAACDDGGSGKVSLSFASTAAANSAVSASVLADPVSDGTNTLDIQSVDITFDEIVLERIEAETEGDSDGESDADSDSDGPENEKIRRGPTTVALPLQGGTITPITDLVEAGRFEEIEMDIASVRVRGTYNGQAFDATIPVNDELEIDFDPPLEVGDGSVNVTVRIDAGTWFRGSDGKLIDPRALASSSSLRAELRNRIRASLDAFEDSDKDADDADSDSDSDGR